jgi:hypothetical protein
MLGMVILAFFLLLLINIYTTKPRKNSDHIHYLAGLKYRLDEPYRLKVQLDSPNMVCRHVSYTDGELLIDREFVWDGMTGMVYNEDAVIRGSLVHDAIYHLMRECNMKASNEKIADELLYKIVVEDGVSWLYAQFIWYYVKYLGKYGRDPRMNTKFHYVS